jgi:quercetin dioxygenase-like cupin family protein
MSLEAVRQPAALKGGNVPFVDLANLETKEPAQGYKAVFVHTDNMTVAYWDVEKGAEMPEHSHPHEQVASVIDGKFELSLAGEKRIMDKGSAATIPPNTPHSGKAITHCRLIDVFHPVREDYR